MLSIIKTQQHESAVTEGSGLFNYELHPDTSLLSETRPSYERLKAYLVEEAVRCLKAGKSPGVDNIPSALLKK